MLAFMVMASVCPKELYFGRPGGKNDSKVGIMFTYKVIQIFPWTIGGRKSERRDLNVKS